MGCDAAYDSHYPIRCAGIWADCARQKAPTVFNDYPAYVGKKGLPEGHAPLQRLISVPVVEEDKVRMIVGVGNKVSDYDEFDCSTVQLLGNDIWRVVGRMRAENKLKQKVSELLAVNKHLDEINDKLLQSEKLAAIGQLAAGVAHEINNPIGYVSSNLNSLTGYAHDLLAINEAYAKVENALEKTVPPVVFEAVHHLKQAVDYDFVVNDIHHLLAESGQGLDRVRKIVVDLKDFSHVGGTGWKKTDLHQGLESTLNIVWNEIKYKASVVKEYGDLPEVFCIPSQINQVFLNLLTNAAQAIKEHGRIILRSGCAEDKVWVEVEDSGAGIAPENLKHIFEPFFTTKPVGKGTGLGLSMSWSIIQRHHGQIEVRSEPGQGAVFRIVLPIEQPDVAESDSETSE